MKRDPRLDELDNLIAATNPPKPKRPKQLIDYAILRRLKAANVPYCEIAQRFGCSVNSIRAAVRRLGIQYKPSDICRIPGCIEPPCRERRSALCREHTKARERQRIAAKKMSTAVPLPAHKTLV